MCQKSYQDSPLISIFFEFGLFEKNISFIFLKILSVPRTGPKKISVPVRIIRTKKSVLRTVPKISVPLYPYHVPYQKYTYHFIRTTYRTKNIRSALSVPRTVPKKSVSLYPYHVPYQENPYQEIRTNVLFRTGTVQRIQFRSIQNHSHTTA